MAVNSKDAKAWLEDALGSLRTEQYANAGIYIREAIKLLDMPTDSDELLREAREQRDWLIEQCGKIGIRVDVAIGAPVSQAYRLSPLPQHWISVKERLPQTFEQVLVNLKPVPKGPAWYPRTNCVLAWQKRGTWFGSFIDPLTGKAESGEFPDDLITHWQPLPVPPVASPQGESK